MVKTSLVRFAFAGLLVAAFCDAALAQPDLRTELPSIGGTEAPALRFENFGLTDGLAQSSVYRMMQDRHGFLWFGSQGGLHRFDGETVTVFQPVPFDTTSVGDAWIWNVSEASDGAIWTANNNGSVSRLDPDTGRFQTFRPDPADSTRLPGGAVFHVVEARDGTVWVAVGNGLARMRPDTPGRFRTLKHDHPDSTSFPGTAYFLREDREGFIWASTNNGLVRLDPATETFVTYLREGERHGGTNSPQSLYDIAEDPDDPRIWWIGSGWGLIRFDTETGQHQRFLAFPDDPVASTRNVHFDVSVDPLDPGILWVPSTGGGLLRFDRYTDRFDRYDVDPGDPNALRSSMTETVFTDRTGTMWVGYTDAGLARFNPASVRIAHVAHDAEDPLAPALGGQLWALLADSRGRLWIGQDDARGIPAVVRFDPRTGEVRQLRHDPSDPTSIRPGTAQSLLEGVDGRIWVGANGPSVCDPETLRCRQYGVSRTDSTMPPPGEIHAFHQAADDPGSIWVGAGWGLYRVDVESGYTTQFSSGVGAERPGPDGVAHILVDRAGTMWLATMGDGLVRFDRDAGRFDYFRYDPTDTTTIANNHAEVVLEREREPGVLWVATFSGLDRFDVATETFRHYGVDKGLANGAIYGLLEDEDGLLWMSTNRGVSSFDPETGTFRNYGLDDGLRALEFQQNGYAKGPDGMLYFADVEGLTAFHPSQLATNPIAPQLAFTALRVSGQHVDPEPGGILETAITEAESITLPYAKNEFSVDFVALHFSDPSKNIYSYRLEGLSDAWSEPGIQRTASYGNLPPGDYTLRVRAANPDGVWTEEGIALRVTVLPPWYRTGWAYALFAVLLAGLVFGIDRLQRYRLLRAERERAAIQEAELRAETAEAEAKALQAENERKKNIERLSEIGAEITASLDVETIFDRLYEHVNELTDAPVFGVGIYHADRRIIDYRMAIENGKRYAPYTRDASDPNQFPVWCVEHRAPVFINDVETEYSQYIAHYEHERGKLEDGSEAQAPESLIYLPLTTQDRVLGVITVQSFRKHAYSENDLNILKTMAAYASVALDNANAYRQLNGTVAELRQTQQQLVQQEKMASLGQLTAGIAHEIKNPLNFVNNFADLNAEMATELRELMSGADAAEIAAKRTELDDLLTSLQQNARQIAKHGRRADEIVKGMMQHARPGDAERYPVAVNDFVDEYLNMVWHGQRAQHPDLDLRVVRRYGDDVGNATLSPQDMGRVIVNLVGNAFDILRDREGAELEISTARSGDQVVIRVADNGPGVPASIRDKIFEPFFTTKPSGQGTGLGLSMAHDIVTQGHGGTMRVEDRPEGGAVFVVTIPAAG